MKIAVISDIHGNIHALKAVLADIKSKRVDRILCTGDLVGYGAFPNEVIETIRDSRIPAVRGNYDDGVGFDKSECGCAYKEPEAEARGQLSFNWTKEHVTSDNKKFLASLPDSISLDVNGKNILLVHGSPRRRNEYLFEDRPESSLRHIKEGIDADILIFGHTHLPYCRIINGTYFVNAGSVGKPKDGDPQAGYITIEINGGISVESIRVPYDVEAAAKAVEESGLPIEFAQMLRMGKG